MFRTTIFTAALSLVAVGSTGAIAQQPGNEARKPSAFDQPLFGQQSIDKPLSMQREEIDAYLRKERAMIEYRRRMLAAEERSRMSVTTLRPNWPSNPRMHSYYSPRRIIYVPYFID